MNTRKAIAAFGIAVAVIGATVAASPASNSSSLQWHQDPAGTIYTGGTRNSVGAIVNAIDTQGYRVFIPAPNAPYVQP